MNFVFIWYYGSGKLLHWLVVYIFGIFSGTQYLNSGNKMSVALPGQSCSVLFLELVKFSFVLSECKIGGWLIKNHQHPEIHEKRRTILRKLKSNGLSHTIDLWRSYHSVATSPTVPVMFPSRSLYLFYRVSGLILNTDSESQTTNTAMNPRYYLPNPSFIEKLLRKWQVKWFILG